MREKERKNKRIDNLGHYTFTTSEKKKPNDEKKENKNQKIHFLH